MSDAVGTGGSPSPVSALDYRLMLAGLMAPLTSSLAVRTGVMVAPGSTNLVTGTSATGTMTVSIAAHHWVTTRGTADGVYIGAKEAAGTVNIAAAPGANSRIDVIYVRQKDASSSISPDGASAEEYGVVTGTAAASPTKPPFTAAHTGAIELATVTVAAGATSTNGAGVTIANTVRQTVLRGGIVPVAAAETDNGAYTGHYRDHPTRGLERWDGTKWASPSPSGQWVNQVTQPGNYSQTLTGSYVDLTGFNVSITVPNGRQLDVEFKLPQLQVSAGGDAALKLLIDSVLQDIAEVAVPSAATGTPLTAAPIRLTGSVIGTGVAVTVQVQGIVVGPSATAHGTGTSGTDTQGPRLRYRIV